MSDAYGERELESQLLQHVERFMLELGRGFAFVGRQLRLDVAGDEFFPDLVFYNFMLRRFVVIELKATKFELGFLGQLGMYMSAVDDLLAQPGDEPTIGLLLCKTKNSLVAEYALRGYKSPIGVAEWATAIKDSYPDEVAQALPTIEELEDELVGREPRTRQGTMKCCAMVAAAMPTKQRLSISSGCPMEISAGVFRIMLMMLGCFDAMSMPWSMDPTKARLCQIVSLLSPNAAKAPVKSLWGMPPGDPSTTTP